MTTTLTITIFLALWLIARIKRTSFMIGMFSTGIEFNPHSINFHLLNFYQFDDWEWGIMIEIYPDITYWCVRYRKWHAWQIGPIAFYGPSRN